MLLAHPPAWLGVLALVLLVGGTVRLTVLAMDVQHGTLRRGDRVAQRAVGVLDAVSGGALAHPEVRAFAPEIPFYRRAEAARALPELRTGAPGYGVPCPTNTSSTSSAR